MLICMKLTVTTRFASNHHQCIQVKIIRLEQKSRCFQEYAKQGLTAGFLSCLTDSQNKRSDDSFIVIKC